MKRSRGRCWFWLEFTAAEMVCSLRTIDVFGTLDEIRELIRTYRTCNSGGYEIQVFHCVQVRRKNQFNYSYLLSNRYKINIPFRNRHHTNKLSVFFFNQKLPNTQTLYSAVTQHCIMSRYKMRIGKKNGQNFIMHFCTIPQSHQHSGAEQTNACNDWH